MSSWEERRLTITADDLLRKQAPVAAAPPVAATPSPSSWAQRKLAGANGWPWREIMTTAGVCLAAAVVVVLILNSGLTLPSLPRRRAVPALTTVEPTVAPTARAVQVEQPPVVIIVTATPIPAQPVQVAPVAPRQVAPQPQARPVQAPAPAARPVQAQAQAAPRSGPAPTMGPQERLLSRPCQFPAAPQGTIIRGYYTDASGVKRDAICRPDGWKAVDQENE